MTFKQLKPPSRSNKQVREYIEAVEKGSRNYFVVQNGHGWYVRKASVRTSRGKSFPTKSEAVNNARTRANRNKSDVLIFSNRGTLLERR